MRWSGEEGEKRGENDCQDLRAVVPINFILQGATFLFLTVALTMASCQELEMSNSPTQFPLA